MNKKGLNVLLVLCFLLGIILISLDDSSAQAFGAILLVFCVVLFALVVPRKLKIWDYVHAIEFESGDARQGVIRSINTDEGSMIIVNVDRPESEYTVWIEGARRVPDSKLELDVLKRACEVRRS